MTASGKPCQKWSEQYPHQHTETHPNLPRAGLGGHSYCRNPSGQQEQVRSAPAARAGLLASPRPHMHRPARLRTHTPKPARTLSSAPPQRRPAPPHTRTRAPTRRAAAPHLTQSPTRPPCDLLQPFCYTTDPAVRTEPCAVPKPFARCLPNEVPHAVTHGAATPCVIGGNPPSGPLPRFRAQCGAAGANATYGAVCSRACCNAAEEAALHCPADAAHRGAYAQYAMDVQWAMLQHGCTGCRVYAPRAAARRLASASALAPPLPTLRPRRQSRARACHRTRKAPLPCPHRLSLRAPPPTKTRSALALIGSPIMRPLPCAALRLSARPSLPATRPSSRART